jgi:hypothetical protein
LSREPDKFKKSAEMRNNESHVNRQLQFGIREVTWQLQFRRVSTVELQLAVAVEVEVQLVTRRIHHLHVRPSHSQIDPHNKSTSSSLGAV